MGRGGRAIEHFGYAPAKDGANPPGVGTIVRPPRAEVYVNPSAAYRVSSRLDDHPGMEPLATSSIEANPRRILRGTGWRPGADTALTGTKATDIAANPPVDRGRLLNLAAGRAPDATRRQAILVHHPYRLAGY
jgi:hypothetical protein